MKSPSLELLKSIEPVLNNRFFQTGFWSLASGLILFITAVLLIHYGPVNSMEYALLDLKMRYKASNYDQPSMRPSSDIVLLGIDSNTDKYIRLHPEAGLNTTIPRDRLAKVVEYLNRQGVRSLVFDLEFKDVKEGDELLAKAISKTPHVFAADRMDNTLIPFEKDQMQPIITGSKRYPLEIFMEKGVLTPYLSYLADFRNRFMPWKTVGLADLGVIPFYRTFPALHEAGAANSVLLQQSNALNNQYGLRNRVLGNFSVSPVPTARQDVYGDMMERAFSELCVNDNYQHYYQNNPGYLRFLRQKQLLLNMEQPPAADVSRKITFCYSFPIVDSLMPYLDSIGVPSIDYDEDAYLRSITALYKGYQGNYYTYLGIRPALDLKGITQLTYTPDSLYLNGREVPLREGEKVFVNWKNPRLMLEQTVRQLNIDLSRFPEIRRAIQRVSPERNNPMLNGGHLYRQISMIDILHLAEGKPLSEDAQSRMYNIPFMAESGHFSFKDKIVVIGNTITDVHRTPISNTTFGPEVVAATIDMFMHDKVFVQQPPGWMLWLGVLVLTVLIAVAIISFENLTIGMSIGIILIVLYWVLNLLAFVTWGLWLELLVPTFALGFSLASATLYRYYIHDQEKHHLTNVFSKYVSPQIMGEIVKNPAKAMDNLKGGKKELTVLFSDLQEFTQKFENADPELMVSQLNEYFDVMTEIILEHGGTYDKYMGDSIMAFFGAPADLPEHAKMACKAAVEMQNALLVLNESWAAAGSIVLSHGIGISSGEMFVGNFGSRNIKNFTVMGSNVNLGSRLETYTRVAHWPIIISARTLELAGKSGMKTKDLGLIQVKGFSTRVQIYGLEQVDGVPVQVEPEQSP